MSIPTEVTIANGGAIAMSSQMNHLHCNRNFNILANAIAS